MYGAIRIPTRRKQVEPDSAQIIEPIRESQLPAGSPRSAATRTRARKLFDVKYTVE